MLVYWILFAYFALGAIFAASSRDEESRGPNILYSFGAIAMALLIGLRYKVGGDWITYEFIYHRAGQLSLSRAVSIGDPAYQALNWTSYQLNVDVWLVNLICGAIFVWGLFRLCRTQPNPWLGVVVAVPYLVIVIAMGYTRQAVALGVLMAGIAAFLRGASPLKFAVYVGVAALFHKTAVVAFPVLAFGARRNRFINLLVVVAGGVALYDAFLGDAMDHFVQNYVHAKYSSQGAAIRILMNVVAAALFFLAGRSLDFDEWEWKLWRNFSIASFISLVALIAIPSSAAVDRMSLYLIPLQIAVIGRVPLIFRSRVFGHAMVISYCFVVELVWLNFAQFADAWVPYRFVPF